MWLLIFLKMRPDALKSNKCVGTPHMSSICFTSEQLYLSLSLSLSLSSICSAHRTRQQALNRHGTSPSSLHSIFCSLRQAKTTTCTCDAQRSQSSRPQLFLHFTSQQHSLSPSVYLLSPLLNLPRVQTNSKTVLSRPPQQLFSQPMSGQAEELGIRAGISNHRSYPGSDVRSVLLDGHVISSRHVGWGGAGWIYLPCPL
jgi:hypothetical protein